MTFCQAKPSQDRMKTLVGPQMSLHGIMGFLSDCSKNLLESPADFILINLVIERFSYDCQKTKIKAITEPITSAS